MREVNHATQLQSADSVLMVRPAQFSFNPQTAASNAFQTNTLAAADSSAAACAEFDRLGEQLTAAGIRVVAADDTDQPVKPDAVFPNNWVSFHGCGTVVLYPMMAPNRRLERREELIDLALGSSAGRGAFRRVDLTYFEAAGRFLEGTGSLVLDRPNRVAFAALSPRTDPAVLAEFGQRLGYEIESFDTADPSGKPIYHTNVLMAVGSRFAVICSTVIDPAARPRVLDRLRATGHDIIEISGAQMREFAGNLLELKAPDGAVVALSETAWRSLGASQRRALEAHARLVVASIPVIERVGGGGVRCMLAEIHRPAAAASGTGVILG